MKRINAIASIILAGALMLCGCGSDAGSGGAADISNAEPVVTSVTTVTALGSVTTAGADVSVPEVTTADNSKAETDVLRHRDYTTKLTENHTISDYTVKAKYVYRDSQSGSMTTFEGEITNEAELQKVWTMLCTAEATQPTKYASVSGSASVGASLTLTPKWGGVEVEIFNGIGYYNEGEEGGPSVMIFMGLMAPETGTFTLDCGEEFQNWLTNFCGETVVARNEITDQFSSPDDSDPPITNSNVAVVSRYTNWAWNVYDKVTFYDVKGNIYTLTLADNEDYSYKPKTVEELLPKFEEMIADENTKPSGRVSEEDIAAIRSLGAAISKDAKMTEPESVMCDGGQTTLYVITDRVTEVRSTGDNEYELDDVNARKLSVIYYKMKDNVEILETMP